MCTCKHYVLTIHLTGRKFVFVRTKTAAMRTKVSMQVYVIKWLRKKLQPDKIDQNKKCPKLNTAFFKVTGAVCVEEQKALVYLEFLQNLFR